jgi:hypothetical protein
LLFLLSFSALAIDDEGQPEEAAEGKAATAEAKKNADSLIPYIPPRPIRAAPDIRTTGGTRWKAVGLPDVTLLVPNHVGLTLAAQPTLYWDLSSETAVRIEITVIDLDDPASVEPLLEVPVKAPVKPGIHGFRSADHGLELESGKTYQWSVAVVPDPDRRASDKIARGFVERIAADDRLRTALADAEGPDRRRILARNGIWYDAFAALSDEIEADPTDDRLRSQRAALLEQVGLSELAAREREAAPKR